MKKFEPKNVSFDKPIEIEAIKKILPHRYPFLLVDRILHVSGNHAVGIKNVTISEPFFQGHFPEHPVMPGVLIVESLAQVAGVILLSKGENEGKIAYLVGIDKARFRRTVIPGDQLTLEVEITKMKSRVGVVEAVARVGEDEACSCEIMFTIVDV